MPVEFKVRPGIGRHTVFMEAQARAQATRDTVYFDFGGRRVWVTGDLSPIDWLTLDDLRLDHEAAQSKPPQIVVDLPTASLEVGSEVACYRAWQTREVVRLLHCGVEIEVFPEEEKEIVMERWREVSENPNSEYVVSRTEPDHNPFTNPIGSEHSQNVSDLLALLDRYMRDEIPMTDLPFVFGEAGVALAVFIKRELVGLGTKVQDDLRISELCDHLAELIAPDTYTTDSEGDSFQIIQQSHVGADRVISRRHDHFRAALEEAIKNVSAQDVNPHTEPNPTIEGYLKLLCVLSGSLHSYSLAASKGSFWVIKHAGSEPKRISPICGSALGALKHAVDYEKNHAAS